MTGKAAGHSKLAADAPISFVQAHADVGERLARILELDTGFPRGRAQTTSTPKISRLSTSTRSTRLS